jgi:hypothetical protein
MVSLARWSEFEEFAADALSPPKWILCRHSLNQAEEVLRKTRATSLGAALKRAFN